MYPNSQFLKEVEAKNQSLFCYMIVFTININIMFVYKALLAIPLSLYFMYV
jgi:hypothetical protein